MNALSARHRVKRIDCITGSPMLSQIRGTDEERGAGTHRSPPIFARTESGATQRGRIRNRRGQKAASGLADRGRRGHGQDQDTRSSGGASDLGRRRPTPSPAADFYTARRARDDAVPVRTEFCADPDGFQTTWLPIRGNLLKMVNLGKLNLVSRNARVGQ